MSNRTPESGDGENRTKQIRGQNFAEMIRDSNPQVWKVIHANKQNPIPKQHTRRETLSMAPDFSKQ